MVTLLSSIWRLCKEELRNCNMLKRTNRPTLHFQMRWLGHHGLLIFSQASSVAGYEQHVIGYIWSEVSSKVLLLNHASVLTELQLVMPKKVLQHKLDMVTMGFCVCACVLMQAHMNVQMRIHLSFTIFGT
jgi:hypothetical protein